MERETKAFKTPLGRELVVKAYITARERNAMRAAILEEVKIDATKVRDETTAQAELQRAAATITAADITDKSEHALIKAMVVSYDDKTDGREILEKLLDSTPKEYDFVRDTAGEASKGFPTAK